MNITTFPFEILTTQSTLHLYDELGELIENYPQPNKFYNRTFAKAWLTIVVPKLNCWFLDDGVKFHMYSRKVFSEYAKAREFADRQAS